MPIMVTMKKYLVLVLFSFSTSSSLMAGTWIEDSLGFAFEFPRGWSKAVLRNSESARIQFAKANRDAILQIDTVRRTKDYDLDRFIEETIDTFLKKYPDLKVAREKVLEEEMQGFDESVFLVLHYTEHKNSISNRFLFHKKGNIYYVLQAKTARSRFSLYARDLDMIMKTFRLEPRVKTRWRNDSLAYLDPIRDEKAIQYISITIRPIDSYPSDKPTSTVSSDTWLNTVDGFKNPFSPNSENTDSPGGSDLDKKPVKSGEDSNGPNVPPETDPL